MSLRQWLVRIGGIAGIGIPIAVVIYDAISGSPALAFNALYAVVIGTFAVVGWLIGERKPGNVEGPLLLVIALIWGLSLPADAYVHLPGPPPGADYVALFISVLDAPLLVVIALFLLLFPDGRPPSPRWNPAVPFAIAVIVISLVGAGLTAGPFELVPGYTNPIGVEGFPGRVLLLLGYVGMLILLVLSAAALVGRWRRGRAVERAQLKWVAAAAVVIVVAEIINVATFNPANTTSPLVIAATLAFALLPASAGIAILRYHLYDIDRVISRTIAYALISGALLVVFVAVVLALQSVLAGFTQGETIPVAASTLVVAALAQPLRRRVQGFVDRWFNRAGVDAERTVAVFAGRLRDEIEMGSLRDELAAAVGGSVQPTSLGVWIRSGGGTAP